jgi:hypothetical protein
MEIEFENDESGNDKAMEMHRAFSRMAKNGLNV